MRIREILQEDYNENLQSDLTNLLVGAKASGATQLNTDQLVNQLYSAGYAVDTSSIVSLLSNNPIVQNVTPEMIELTPPDDASLQNNDNQEDSADQVSSMAQQATQKSLK